MLPELLLGVIEYPGLSQVIMTVSRKLVVTDHEDMDDAIPGLKG